MFSRFIDWLDWEKIKKATRRWTNRCPPRSLRYTWQLRVENKKPLRSRLSCWQQQRGRDECRSVEETQMKHEVCAETRGEEEEDGSSTYERASRDDSSSSDRLAHAKNDFHPQPNKCQVTVCTRQRRFSLWLNAPHVTVAFHNMSVTRAGPRADLENQGAKRTTNNHHKNCCLWASEQGASPPNRCRGLEATFTPTETPPAARRRIQILVTQCISMPTATVLMC